MRLHSILSPKCQVRMSQIDGKGVFAVDHIDAEELLAVWGGKVYTADEVEQISTEHPHFLSHPISVYDGFYLGSTSLVDCDDAEMFNHSCSPNAGIKGQIVLIARRSIAIGEEICFDYDTTETWAVPFSCNCGAENCRGRIDGQAWKDPGFQRLNRGWFSWHIAKQILLQ